MLITAVMSSAAYIYSCGNAGTIALYTLFTAAYTFALFALFELLRKKNKTLLTVGAVTGLFLLVFAVAPVLIGRGAGEFMQWFMEPSRFNRVFGERITALILMLGSVLVSAFYYFTKIQYRGFFLFLICMCPFCLFAKTFTDIPVIYPIVITTLFFVIMIENAGGKHPERDKGYYSAAFAFMTVITVVAAFFPKAEYAPYREEFDEFITGVNIGAAGRADFSDFSDTSSGAVSNDDSPVFEIYGDNPVLIKRQCFNMYDGRDNIWTYYGDSNNGNSDWQEYVVFEDPEPLYELTGFNGEKTEEKKCTVRSADNRIRAIYTCQNMKNIEMGSYDGKIYRTELDEYFLSYDSPYLPSSYYMSWTELEPDPAFSESFTDERAAALAESSRYEEAVYSYIRAKAQAVKYNTHLLSDSVRRSCYSSKNAWEKVAELTARITEGCESDYDKALAIESYLKDTDYIYDKDFTAADASPDYFIFTSKRGTCTIYATAMTLMCREAGLTARYVEGFWAQTYDSDKQCWTIAANDSHAFVQVWLNGYGWTDFNPVSGKTDGGFFDATFIYVGSLALIAAAAGLAAIVLRPLIRERIFTRRLRKARGTQQALMIYRRINAGLCEYAGHRENTFTPKETALYAKERLGFDMDAFTELYELAVYGGRCDENADLSYVYDGYLNAVREDKKRSRREAKAERSGKK